MTTINLLLIKHQLRPPLIVNFVVKARVKPAYSRFSSREAAALPGSTSISIFLYRSLQICFALWVKTCISSQLLLIGADDSSLIA